MVVAVNDYKRGNVKFCSRFLMVVILSSLTACGTADNFAKAAFKRAEIIVAKEATKAAAEEVKRQLSVPPRCFVYGSRDCSSAELSQQTLSDIDLSNAVFDRADLSGADLSDSDLRGSSFVGADLEKADLSGALIDGANFDGANLSGATMPDGTIHD